MAVAFYDRREACPNDQSILPGHVGDANTCIDISLQAYKDAGSAAGAVPVGGNVRVSPFTWDPDQPQQTVDGINQNACAGHNDPCPTGRAFHRRLLRSRDLAGQRLHARGLHPLPL